MRFVVLGVIHMTRFLSGLLFGVFGVWLIFSAGCTTTSSKEKIVAQPPSLARAPVFPPQKAMETGDYATFLAENEKAIKECDAGGECDAALFNLGFLNAYSRSPYYNQSRALKYFDELIKKYPHSPYAFQARAWVDIMRRSIASEKGRRRLKSEVKSRDSTIDKLQSQIDRSREIDMEMDRKERELLQ